ncbi:hypothetical protein BTVI_34142 [Pitangus sulphuratus]|nr:hypothetical protein BTVI_34142 [Pitangus sulphuratus]
MEFMQSFMGSHTPGIPSVFGAKHDSVYSPGDTMVQYMELFNKIRKQQQVPVAGIRHNPSAVLPLIWFKSFNTPKGNSFSYGKISRNSCIPVMGASPGGESIGKAGNREQIKWDDKESENKVLGRGLRAERLLELRDEGTRERGAGSEKPLKTIPGFEVGIQVVWKEGLGGDVMK